MKSDCIDIERIGEILALSENTPERQHVETCPRCSVLAASYHAFLQGTDVTGADTDDADRRLSQWRQQHIETPPPTRRDTELGGIFSTIFGGLSRRPALAMAAIVVIAAVVVWTNMDRTAEPVLRGNDTPAVQALALNAPVVRADGDVVLSWAPHEGAESYDVRFYAEDLFEIARFSTTTHTFVLSPGQLPGDLAGSALLWRVVVLQNGDEIEASAPGTIQAP